MAPNSSIIATFGLIFVIHLSQSNIRYTQNDHPNIEEKERQLILDVHNRLRENVDPGPAIGMYKLVWNESLLLLAQKSADQCVLAPNLHVGPKFLKRKLGTKEKKEIIKESLLQDPNGSSSFGQTLELRIQTEKDNYDYCNKTCKDTCEIYTQVVWANTKSVACGSSICSTDNAFWKLYDCLYYPPGNSLGQVPYEVDKTTREEYCDKKGTYIHHPTSLKIQGSDQSNKNKEVEAPKNDDGEKDEEQQDGEKEDESSTAEILQAALSDAAKESDILLIMGLELVIIFMWAFPR